MQPLQQAALDAVRRWPGKTASELADLVGYRDPRKINRRLTELAALGLISRSDEARLCTVGGRKASEWLPVGDEVAPPEPWTRIGDAAKAVDRSPATLRSWCEAGAPHRWNGQGREFQLSALRQWAAERQEKNDEREAARQRMREEEAKRQRERLDRVSIEQARINACQAVVRQICGRGFSDSPTAEQALARVLFWADRYPKDVEKAVSGLPGANREWLREQLAAARCA